MLILYSLKSQCVSKAYIYELNILGVLFNMTLDSSLPLNMSSKLSIITLYTEHIKGKWYSTSTSPSSHTLHTFVFDRLWCHNTTSIPSLCDSVQRSVTAQQELILVLVIRQGWIRSIGLLALFWTQHSRLIFAIS